MPDTLKANIESAINATEGQPGEVVAAAVQGAASAPLPPPPAVALGFVWKALVVGLIAILVLSLLGIIWVVQDAAATTSPDVLVTVFTTSLAGLLGLFVKGPA